MNLLDPDHSKIDMSGGNHREILYSLSISLSHTHNTHTQQWGLLRVICFLMGFSKSSQTCGVEHTQRWVQLTQDLLIGLIQLSLHKDTATKNMQTLTDIFTQPLTYKKYFLLRSLSSYSSKKSTCLIIWVREMVENGPKKCIMTAFGVKKIWHTIFLW